MDTDCFKELCSANENLAEENISPESSSIEDSSEESSSIEEDSTEESMSIEEESTEESISMEEDSIEDGNDTDDLDSELGDPSTEENSVEENNSAEEESTEESSSTEELSSLTEDDSKEDKSSMEDDSKEDKSSMEDDSKEDKSSMEEDSAEKQEYWIEEHGLVYKDIGSVDRSVKIVIIGSEDCGKTELIKGVFGDHHSFSIAKYATRIEYTISLPSLFHIWICDVEKTEFAKKETFSDKTVFLLCYDVDDPGSFSSLERAWIPTILKKPMKEMYYFLVSIKRKPKTETKAKKLKKEEQKIALKVKEMNRIFKTGSLIECYIDHKLSLLNVFQSALDVVYHQ